MGALETKKQPVFSGNTLGRCASADSEGNSNATKLEFSMSEGENPRFSGSTGQAKKLCHKTSPPTWLGQVNVEWDRSLFQPGNGWMIDTADEVKALLTNEVDLERLARERNWVSVAGLVEAWEM